MRAYKLPMKYYALVAIALAAANILIYKNTPAAPVASVHIFATGKGTIALVEVPHETILIDTGSDASILRDLGQTLPMWQRSIDAVVLTSDKTAQAGGLSILKERYQVGQVFHAGTASLSYGSQIKIGGAAITVLAPDVFNIIRGDTLVRVSSSTSPGEYSL